jgi:sterol 22-desaturase
MLHPLSHAFTVRFCVTISALVGLMGLCAWEQFRYRQRKAHLAGPTWTVPLVGAILDSLYPTFESYLEKWKSGPLSVVTVFQR